MLLPGAGSAPFFTFYCHFVQSIQHFLFRREQLDFNEKEKFIWRNAFIDCGHYRDDDDIALTIDHIAVRLDEHSKMVATRNLKETRAPHPNQHIRFANW